MRKMEKRKKLFLCLLVCVVFSMLVACEGEEQKLTLVMMTDIASVDDKSYNETAWNGVLRYAKLRNLPVKNYTHVNASTREDIVFKLSNFADNHVDLIIATGYYFADNIAFVALCRGGLLCLATTKSFIKRIGIGTKSRRKN